MGSVGHGAPHKLIDDAGKSNHQKHEHKTDNTRGNRQSRGWRLPLPHPDVAHPGVNDAGHAPKERRAAPEVLGNGTRPADDKDPEQTPAPTATNCPQTTP